MTAAPDPSATPAPTKRQEFAAIIAISAPLAAAYLAEFAMVVTDMMFVGRLGTVELAAVGLAGNLTYDALSVSIGVISIVGVMVAQAHGRNDKAEASRCVRQGLWIAAFLSVLGLGFCLALVPLLALTGQEPQVLDLANDYVTALMWSFPPTMIYTVLANFLAALGRAHVIMVVAVISVGLNMVVNYTLVFGNFGFPALGVAGAGYGSIDRQFLHAGLPVGLRPLVDGDPGLHDLSRPATTGAQGVGRHPAPRPADRRHHAWPKAACSRLSPS